VLLLGGVLLARASGYGYRALNKSMRKPLEAASAPLPAGSKPLPPAERLAKLERDNKRLAAAVADRVPKGHYLVIDQTHNRIYLKNHNQTELEGICSAGGGVVLIEKGGRNRKWVFDTPRGQFKVMQRRENPVWKKPDWAFVEEGQPLPRRESERFEYGMLGEYALSIGDGYMIHGTLYERLLGRSVTHGCIRVGRDDLRKIYAAAPLGTPIYIF